jgi:hypothetical protein
MHAPGHALKPKPRIIQWAMTKRMWK